MPITQQVVTKDNVSAVNQPYYYNIKTREHCCLLIIDRYDQHSLKLLGVILFIKYQQIDVLYDEDTISWTI
eukprot:UN01913